jgi:hypothetical protein
MKHIFIEIFYQARYWLILCVYYFKYKGLYFIDPRYRNFFFWATGLYDSNYKRLVKLVLAIDHTTKSASNLSLEKMTTDLATNWAEYQVFRAAMCSMENYVFEYGTDMSKASVEEKYKWRYYIEKQFGHDVKESGIGYAKKSFKEEYGFSVQHMVHYIETFDKNTAFGKSCIKHKMNLTKEYWINRFEQRVIEVFPIEVSQCIGRPQYNEHPSGN